MGSLVARRQSGPPPSLEKASKFDNQFLVYRVFRDVRVFLRVFQMIEEHSGRPVSGLVSPFRIEVPVGSN